MNGNNSNNNNHSDNYRFDHAAQVVPNIGEAVAWYMENIPGATVLYQDATWGFVEVNGAKLAFVTQDQHPGHLAWRVGDAELTRLAHKFGREPKAHRDGTRSFYVVAPGNQGVEFISYQGSVYADTEADRPVAAPTG